MTIRLFWGPVNSPHKWPVTRKMFPFDDAIMSVTTADILMTQGVMASSVMLLNWFSRNISLLAPEEATRQSMLFQANLALVTYSFGKRIVPWTRAGSRMKTKNFKRRFLPHHKSQRRDIWCTSRPVVFCFNPNFVDRSVLHEAKERRVKYRRCFGNIPAEFR